MDFNQSPNNEQQHFPQTQPLAEPQPPVLKPHKNFSVIVLGLVVISYVFGYKMGNKGMVLEPKEFKVVNQNEVPQVVDYNLLWDAIGVLNTKYIDKPVNPQQVLYGAVRGAIASTGDPYTDFFEPKQLQSFKTDLKGSFDGIGAEIGKRNGFITIIAPLDGTPAQRAGLLAKDVIVQVNGKSTQEWSVEETVNEIRGEKGTEVTLTIAREGKDQPFEVKMKREKIEVKSVKWQYKDVVKDGQTKKIAVITISKFGDDTKPLFDKAVNEILTKSVDGLVIDLRNNPGGYLQTAVELASNWLAPGTIVVTEARSDGTSQKYTAHGANRLANIKTTILINGGSASASEILAGALHDYKITTLVGEKSFGKGSVQELIDLKDGSAVKVTVAKWITPNGKNLNKDGLEPEVAIKLTEENITKGEDPQLEKALEEVTK